MSGRELTRSGDEEDTPMMCIGWRSKASCYDGALPASCPANPWFWALVALVALDLLRGRKKA